MTSTGTLQPDQLIPEIQPVFARHETFHPRFGWLKKGFDAASEDPEVFLSADAPTRLGVGKNMVRAIRYWCHAYKVLEEAPNPDNTRLRNAYPSEFGQKLMGPKGWDAYLEAPGSLWLLHWQLFRSPCIAPAWHVAFNTFRKQDFVEPDLIQELKYFRDAQGWASIVDASLKKDADCILRVFAGGSGAREVLEDSIDSPFAELGLIRRTRGDSRHFSFNTGTKSNLPDAIVAFACLDFAASQDRSSRSISMARLTYEEGSPGLIFKLTESAIADALERYADFTSRIQLVDVIGMQNVTFFDDAQTLAEDVLDDYYRAQSKGGSR